MPAKKRTFHKKAPSVEKAAPEPLAAVSPQPVPVPEPVHEESTPTHELPQPLPWHQAADPAVEQSTPDLAAPQVAADNSPVAEPTILTTEEQTPQTSPSPSQLPDISDSNESSHKKLYFLCVFCSLVFFIVGLAAGYLLSDKIKSAFPAPNQSNNQTTMDQVTDTPEPTPTPVMVDKSKFSIRVLNGTTASGVAAKAKTELESVGFKVASVGNANDSNYEKTVIQAKTSVDESFLSEPASQLEKSYSLGDNEELPSTASADVIVIIGKSN